MQRCSPLCPFSLFTHIYNCVLRACAYTGFIGSKCVYLCGIMYVYRWVGEIAPIGGDCIRMRADSEKE